MSSPAHKSGPIKTLSIGGATFDLFIKTDASLIKDGKAFELPLGHKIPIRDVIGCPGGGAHNTAVSLARLGCHAAFSGVIGEDQWGEAIQKNLQKEGIDTHYLTIIEHEHSSFSVVLMSESGERTILTHKGMDRHLNDVTFDREALQHVDAVYLNHIHQDTNVIEDDIIDILIDAPTVHLSWNPGGSQIDAGLRQKNNKLLVAHTDLLLLNKEEALAFSGTPTVREALRALIDAGATIVCITDGPNGSMTTDGKTLYHCPTKPCDVVDMTGAGDAFGSAMTWAVLSHKDLPTALKAGTIQAMSVVGAVGAQAGLLTDTQIQTQLTESDLAVTIEHL